MKNHNELWRKGWIEKQFIAAQDLIIDVAQIAYIRPLSTSGKVAITTIKGNRLAATAFTLDRLWEAVRNSEFNARNGICSVFSFCAPASADQTAKYADFNIAAFLAADGKGNVKFCPANQIAALGSEGNVICDADRRVYHAANAGNFFIGFYSAFNDARKDV